MPSSFPTIKARLAVVYDVIIPGAGIWRWDTQQEAQNFASVNSAPNCRTVFDAPAKKFLKEQGLIRKKQKPGDVKRRRNRQDVKYEPKDI